MPPARRLPPPRLRPHPSPRLRRRNKLRSFPRKREPRAKNWVPAFAGTNGQGRVTLTPTSIRSSRCARRRATSARRKPRAAPSSRRSPAGSPARTASMCRACRAPARTAASSRPTSNPPSPKGGRAAPQQAGGASAAQVKALYQGVEFEEVPLDGMRATIARRLVEAKQTIPHFYLTADVTMDALLKIREEANAGAPKNKGKATRLQALGQRLRHQGAGARLAARAGGERGVGRRPHPALQALRRRRRGRDRRRAC